MSDLLALHHAARVTARAERLRRGGGGGGGGGDGVGGGAGASGEVGAAAALLGASHTRQEELLRACWADTDADRVPHWGPECRENTGRAFWVLTSSRTQMAMYSTRTMD